MFSIDYRSRTPIYRQIIDNVENLAARGVLQPDGQLPSVRSLAVELSINPNTIAKAYSELEAKGIIYSLPGRGSFLCGNSCALRQQIIDNLSQKLEEDAAEAHQIVMEQEDFMDLCDKAWNKKPGKGAAK